MSRRTHRLLALAACAAATLALAPSVSATAAATAAASAGRGDVWWDDTRGLPTTELLGENGPPVPMKDQAQIVVSEFGLRYLAGQQNSHLTITEVDGKLRFADTGTQRWRKLPKQCVAQSVSRGVAALCSIPTQYQDDERMFLEIWPRLGNDYVDGRTLSARYRMWVLVDAGNDTVLAGDGDDFVNGAQNSDRIWGGAGDDWLRSGLAGDRVSGGAGRDKIVGAEGNDNVFGGVGDDSLFGAPGDDVIHADEGADSVVGGPGRDQAYGEDFDRIIQCESVHTS